MTGTRTSPAFKKLMNHRATVIKRDRNLEGDWVDLKTHSNVPAFFQWGKRLVTNRQGEEVPAAAIVFMLPDAPIDSEHEYWEVEQTSPYSRKEAKVIRVDPIDDPRTGKTHHLEVAVE